LFLNTIVIVLRETLESGILISLFLAIAYRYRLSAFWLLAAIIVGLFFAVLYAVNLASISDWFGYVGQEVVNATLHYAIYACLLVISALICGNGGESAKILQCFMATAVALALVRECGEIVIFYSGLLQSGETIIHTSTSGLIGLFIGLSVGALVYYSLVNVPSERAQTIQQFVLLLVGGGMVLQATQLLIQADWLPSLKPLWDSSGLLNESSLMGQLTFALFGYEATPSILEVSIYVGAMLLMGLAKMSWRRRMTMPS
jgi:high-affinity iron transporter